MRAMAPIYLVAQSTIAGEVAGVGVQAGLEVVLDVQYRVGGARA